MDLTISSVLTTCIWTSILIVALCVLCKSRVAMKRIGPRCMIIVFMVIIIRMFVPIEFPFTYSWYVEDFLTPFRRLFEFKLLERPVIFKVWHLLIAVWAVGVLLGIVRRVYAYTAFMRYMKLLPEESWHVLAEKYQLDLSRYSQIEQIKIVFCQQVDSPYVFGVKTSYLVLPAKEYAKEQFYYILLHEVMHVRNRDVLWKVLIDLLCTVFWWNPVFYYLKREMFQMIEMRNDMQILSLLSEEEKISYMQCLKDVAVQLAGKDVSFGVAFSRNNLRELHRRMDFIAHFKEFGTCLQLMLCVAVFAFLMLSSVVVVEPYSFDQDSVGIAMTDDNTYLIKNGDQYEVYIDGVYIFKTDDLAPFKNVKIYNNSQEVDTND
ncbi:MAG: M56 family metallopeptidase [Lachnospiraceae bacterium]